VLAGILTSVSNPPARAPRSSSGAPRYRAFFEALGTLSEGTPAWRAVLAGLVTMRYLDAWADGGVGPPELAAEREAVEATIDALGRDAVDRVFLAGLVGVSAGEPVADLARVASLLLAYGRSLQQRSTWGLAVDVFARVYEACAGSARTAFESELAASAVLRIGQCQRKLGDAPAAEAAYRTAMTLGRGRGEEYTVLKARLGLANLTADRGNLPSADQQFAAIIGDAVSDRTREVRAHAWHDRAIVAQRRGRTADAIEYAYEAWAAAQDPPSRERILVDLAGIAASAGYRDTARDAYAVLAGTAKEPWVQWVAAINLMELAALERHEAEFARLRRALSAVVLPPVIEAEFLYHSGVGDLAFGRPAPAVEALQRALEMAEDRRLGELLFRVEAALACARAGAPPPAAAMPATPPERLAHVSAALSSARLLAGVAN
jgi:tetratricopeptide (TPR) repeat protein